MYLGDPTADMLHPTWLLQAMCMPGSLVWVLSLSSELVSWGLFLTCFLSLVLSAIVSSRWHIEGVLSPDGWWVSRWVQVVTTCSHLSQDLTVGVHFSSCSWGRDRGLHLIWSNSYKLHLYDMNKSHLIRKKWSWSGPLYRPDPIHKTKLVSTEKWW